MTEPHPPLDEERRRARERAKARHLVGSGDPIRRTAAAVLRWSGLRGAGRKRALALRLETNRLVIAGLPAAFEGFRILQISDPHYPEQRDMPLEHGIVDLATHTPHDLCVLTGDYRDRSFGPFDGALEALVQLRPALAGQALAVLGNHDPLDLVEPMRKLDYEVLMNASIRLQRDGASLVVSGIDDPSYYRTDDLQAAIPESGCSVLLAHSPDRHEQAAQRGAKAYLCGHTHGGQICLPGGFALRRNSRVPPALVSGAWRTGAMSGYTSRGAGTSIIDARFFCPPELTLHVLSGDTAAAG